MRFAIRNLAFLAAIAVLAPGSVSALSCVRPSIERTFAQINAVPEAYIVVHGRLTVDERKLPRAGTTHSNPPKLTRLPGRLKGRSLSLAGFETPYDQQITLEVACFGPWCGSAVNGEDVLAFVRKGKAGYVLEISPCGGRVFGAPKSAQLKKVTQCLRGASCKAR